MPFGHGPSAESGMEAPNIQIGWSRLRDTTEPAAAPLEGQMAKPRVFLGSSGKQQRMLSALTRGLSDICDVQPWTTVFNPGTTTLDRLLELTREVDFAVLVFAQDDWT